MKRAFLWAVLLIGAAVIIGLMRARSRPLPPKPRTVEGGLAAIGLRVDARWQPDFRRAGVAYPPGRALLRAFKRERRLEVWAGGASGPLVFIRSRPILGASGREGPKVREGDRQVPEGFYRIESLNPNSRFHLSLRVNYPNAEDRARAATEGRDPATLGGDIMIHGGTASVGCLAVGDPAAEDLFVLAARTGAEAVELQIFPWDLRRFPPPENVSGNLADLYARLKAALGEQP